jgi:hypothetical protein
MFVQQQHTDNAQHLIRETLTRVIFHKTFCSYTVIISHIPVLLLNNTQNNTINTNNTQNNTINTNNIQNNTINTNNTQNNTINTNNIQNNTVNTNNTQNNTINTNNTQNNTINQLGRVQTVPRLQ